MNTVQEADVTNEQDSTATSLTERVEAILISAARPSSAGTIAEALGLDAQHDAVGQIEASVTSLNEQYEATGRSFRIDRVAGGFRVMTLRAFAQDIAGFLGPRDGGKLSKAALESLAIVAYQQPVTRAKLEAIRGVACGEVLRTLIERKLLSITGRAEEPGRPLLYGTSRRFLEIFGLTSIRDLPRIDELPLGEIQ